MAGGDRGGLRVAAAMFVGCLSAPPAAAQAVPVDTGSLDFWEAHADGRRVPADTVFALPNAQGPLVDSGGFEVFDVDGTPVSFVFDGRDLTAPVVTAPPDVTAECRGPAGQAVALGVAAASDGRDAAPTLSHDAPPLFQLGATPVTWTATDASGNQASATQLVTVEDSTPPTLRAPPDLVVECTGPAGSPVALGRASASDLCDPAPALAHNAPPLFPLGVTQVIWTARDAAGLESRAVQTVTVQDTTPPGLTVPADLVLAAPAGQLVRPGDADLSAWLGTAIASDLCDPAPSVTHDAPATLGVGESALVTFVARDTAGNARSGAATLSVVEQRLTISSPLPGSCAPGPVTLVFNHTGASVTVAGTRTASGVSHPAGPGPVYAAHGEYRLTVTSTTPRGALSANVAFAIDALPPTIAIAAPLALPRPGEVPAEYRVSLDPETHDLPIAVDFVSHDDDGVPGGVVAETVLLDGQPLDARSQRLRPALGEPVFSPLPGDHALRIHGLPGPRKYSWHPDARPLFHVFPTGEALLRGRIYAHLQPGRQWDLELWFHAAPLQAGGHRRELHAAHYAPGGLVQPSTWEVFDLDPARSSFVGREQFAGRVLQPTQDAGGQLHVGIGASGRNLELGLSALLDLSGDASGHATLNANLDPPERVLSRGIFARLGLPVLGLHTLEVQARDACGNLAVAARPFEVVLYAKWGLLAIDADSLGASWPELLAVSLLPPLVTANPLDPGIGDIVPASLRLEARDTGRSAPASHAVLDPQSAVLGSTYPKSALIDASGGLGTRFRLTGRFFSTTGPRFVADTDVPH